MKESGVSLPRLLHNVRPQYTAEAMRERIEGKVALECVVETNGTVQRVRLLRSLDKLYGLDEQAIKAAKQWTFAPGTKDGVAVPVLITIDLTFVLRAPAPPAFTWPENFTSSDEGEPGSAPWTEVVEDVSNVQIRVAYPDGWMRPRGGSPTRLVTIVSPAAGGSHFCFVQKPTPVRFQIGPSVPAEALQRLADLAKEDKKTPAGPAKVMGLGQVRAAGRTWIWYDLQMPTFDPQQLPPSLSPITVDLFDTARMWTFITTAGTQEVIVACVALHSRGMAETDAQRDLQRAAAEFGGILKRISIEPQ